MENNDFFWERLGDITKVILVVWLIVIIIKVIK